MRLVPGGKTHRSLRLEPLMAKLGRNADANVYEKYIVLV
jgi:hypothetical protein